MDLTNSNLSSVSIGSHEKSNNFVSDKPSLKSYATRVFQGSSIGIVSSIFSTHSKRRRFFKVFFSSLCTAGFIYHCITFLSHVWTYPEVVSISVDRSKTYILPAYTYCFNNPIARSVFCSLDPQYCVQPSKEFCRNFSSYCGANATLIPKKEYYNELPRSFQAQWILNFGRVQNILEGDITGHEWFSRRKEISGPYLRTPYSFYDLKPCYSIHSLVESNLEPLLKSRPDAGTFPFFRDDTLRFHLNETEMLNPESEPGVYFSVHSPFEAVNPFRKGIFLKSGKTYRLYVKMQEEILLKSPFESNCLDYDELWLKNNRTGPRTEKMCQEKCFLDRQMFQQRCAHHFVLYPHKEKICEDQPNVTVFDMPSDEETKKFYDNCRANCRGECRSLKYTAEMSMQDQIRDVKEEEMHRLLDVNIRTPNNIKVLRHTPKYETVDVISSVGGSMGCWLGVALMDILDVFGSIITVCRYAFRKRLNKGNKKSSVHVI